MSTTSAAYKSEDFQDSEIVQKLVDLALLEKAPFRKWHFVTGSDKAPTPVHLTLRRLDSFITREFIEPGMEVECLTLATDVNIAEIRENIKTALLEYPIDPPSPAFQPIVRQFRSDWPRGTYALLKTINCPNSFGSQIWYGTGKRVLQDTLAVFVESLSEGEFDVTLDPEVRGWSELTLRFCVKLADSSTGQSDWPQGSYCVFKKRACPVAFQMGSIKIPSRSVDSESDALPDGEYTGTSTTFEFCCRNDKPVDEAIILPPSQPFTLLSSGGQCQKVAGMQSSLRIQSLRRGDIDGFAPFVTSGETNRRLERMRLHLCYYKPWTPNPF
ncbi:hypothetical protein RvY_18413-2 [Ramazzottius varieornatus]|uniref:Apextrin C-terminal domain-containing protein n=1 Tax=Ramazzottius varieornatus TaxID=947166 RepID=A0A1D1W643_RAMVA|nr:hypothetical protein RvY_18413-2 [Ramazzottius varieornatus]